MIFFVLGVVGLMVVEIELGLIEGPVRKMVQGQANQGAGDFSKQVELAVNAHMNGTSSDYARDSNKIIMRVQDGINKDLVCRELVVLESSVRSGTYELSCSLDGSTSLLLL